MADRIVVMNQGAIEQVGTPQEIYRRPATAFVADFVGSMNFLAGTLLAPDKVKVAGLTFDCAAQDGLAPGSKVALCIRPEDVRVRDLPADVANRVAVEVAELDFVGAFCRATLKVQRRRRRGDDGRLLQQPDPRPRCRARPKARRRLAARPAAGVRRVSLAEARRPILRVAMSRDDLVMRAGVLLLALVLLVIVGLPLWALLAKGFEDRDGKFVGLANYASYFSTPALFDSALNSFHVAAVCTLIVVPLAFFYAYALTRTVLPARWLFQGISLIPIFAPSLLPGLALVYLFGNQGFFKGLLGGLDLRLRRHRHRPGLLLLPARHPDPGDGAGHRRRAPLRGGRCAGRLEAPRLLHRDAARRQVRPDQRGAGRVHPGDDRLRHRQGDRRQFQRAGDRRLQAGDRPAELLHGRRGRHDAAGAGRARLRGRPRGPEKAGGVADGARRAAHSPAEARPRPVFHGLLQHRLGRHPRHPRHGHLGIADQVLAVQSQPHPRKLCLRQLRRRRLGFLLQLAADGRGRGDLSAPP